MNPNSTVVNNFRFPGQYYDSETGLHYNYHRYYDPETGRYLRADPIGLAGGINLFVYVENNPVNSIDPLGLELEVIGTPEEKALINSWLNILANLSCESDSEISDRLQAIIDSPILFTIQFSPFKLVRTGQYKDYNVTLDKALMDPNQQVFFYNTPLFSKYSEGYYGGVDTIAHELLGHGFDAANGDYRNNQQLI